MKRAIQQFQLRTTVQSEEQARTTLRLVKEAGYEGIDLNGFMIRKMPFYLPMLTRLAGMPIGRSGLLNWKALIDESRLEVVGLHEDLGSTLGDPEAIVEEVRSFGTGYVVVTGMFRCDFSRQEAVIELSRKLNWAGKLLKQGRVNLLYHNHNSEFRKVESGRPAYEILMEYTDFECVNVEYDSYWAIVASCDTVQWMDALGNRAKMLHIDDRGTRVKGPAGSMLKFDSIELGFGNVNLLGLIASAKENGVEAIILETHKNWVDNSPVKSAQLSAEFLKNHL